MPAIKPIEKAPDSNDGTFGAPCSDRKEKSNVETEGFLQFYNVYFCRAPHILLRLLSAFRATVIKNIRSRNVIMMVLEMHNSVTLLTDTEYKESERGSSNTYLCHRA